MNKKMNCIEGGKGRIIISNIKIKFVAGCRLQVAGYRLQVV
jgi:hypothetical protein